MINTEFILNVVGEEDEYFFEEVFKFSKLFPDGMEINISNIKKLLDMGFPVETLLLYSSECLGLSEEDIESFDDQFQKIYDKYEKKMNDNSGENKKEVLIYNMLNLELKYEELSDLFYKWFVYIDVNNTNK